MILKCFSFFYRFSFIVFTTLLHLLILYLRNWFIFNCFNWLYYNFLCYKILIILVDNNVNKVHRKFPIDTCLIYLKFFPTIRCYYSDWFSFYFTYDCQVHLDWFIHTDIFLRNKIFQTTFIDHSEQWIHFVENLSLGLGLLLSAKWRYCKSFRNLFLVNREATIVFQLSKHISQYIERLAYGM